MKIRYLIYSILAVSALSLSACSDDDDIKDPDMEVMESDVDQLAILRSSLLTEDENGSVSILRGVSLDPGNPTVLSISVENYNDAFSRFSDLFGSETEKSEDGTIYTLPDNGGSTRFAKGNNEDGLVAYAEFSVPSIPQITRINYILHSAWPDNAGGKGFHKFGVVYQYHGWSGSCSGIYSPTPNVDSGEWFDYVCVREYNNGEPALLIAITSTKYHFRWRKHSEYSANIPGESRAKTISGILQKNWDSLARIFNRNGDVLNKGEYYWIDKGKDWGVAEYRDAVRLSDGDVDDWDVKYKKPKKRTLFFLESKERL